MAEIDKLRMQENSLPEDIFKLIDYARNNENPVSWSKLFIYIQNHFNTNYKTVNVIKNRYIRIKQKKNLA